MPPTIQTMTSPLPPHDLPERTLLSTIVKRTVTTILAPLPPKDLPEDSLIKRTVSTNLSPVPPKPLDQTLKVHLFKRWSCGSNYSSDCSSHRTAILCIIIAVIALKILFVTLLVLRHRKRKAARTAESKRIQDQIEKQMAERNAADVAAAAPRVWKEVAPPPYDANLVRKPEPAKDLVWGVDRKTMERKG